MKKNIFFSLIVLTQISYLNAVEFKNESNRTVNLLVSKITGTIELGKVVGPLETVTVKSNEHYIADLHYLEIRPIAKISCLPCCCKIQPKSPFMRLKENTVITLHEDLTASREN